VRIAWGQERLLFSSEGHHFEHLRFVGEGPHGEGVVLARRHPPRGRPELVVVKAPRYAHGLTDARGQPLGIVHRDVCPSNIRVSRGGQVKLTGFGVAWSNLPGREETTEDGAVLGDSDYAPPERLFAGGARRHHDARGELFSLGLVLLELVTGQHLSSPAPSAKARPLPPPAECPQGAVETMTNTFGIHIAQMSSATTDLDMTRHVGLRPVSEGEVTFRLGLELGRLPRRTLLKGRLFVRDRVYGRFTEAQTPDGQVFPVCLVLVDADDWYLGLQREHQRGSDTPMVFSKFKVRAVDRFE